MIARAPAKINWDLRILGKRPDQFHELDSIFVTLSIHDEMTFAEAGELTLTCSDPVLPVDGANLIIKAARKLQDASGVRTGATIHVEKHIPMGGGMGGGSSDAACALVALNTLWGLNWPIERLLPLAAEIGSDVSFFLSGGWALCRGRGEIVEPLPGSERWSALKLALVLPPLHVSTPMVYKALNAPPLGTEPGREASGAAAEMSSNFRNLRAGTLELRNDLTAAALSIEPRMKEIQEVLERHLPGRWSMSGSGSSHFAVLPEGVFDFRKLGEELRAALPGTRTLEAQTVGEL